MKVFLILLLLPSIVFGLEQTDCFQYYKFQNGIVFDSLNPEKIYYKPGEDVIISYNLISKMESPVVEGKVRAQIFYNHPEEGEIMIDEFFVAKDINIMYNEIIPQEFRWKVPKYAENGEYIVKLYFISGDMFNLAGLSFLAYGPPGVPGEQTTFYVENSNESTIYFSKKETYINEEKYFFGSFSPIFDQTSFKIKTKLINIGKEKDVSIKMKIYEWDDLTEIPIERYTKTENIRVSKEKEILFDIPSLTPGTYLVKLIAESGGEKSIMKIRFSISGAKGRFIYLGITDFPIKSGKENTLFICLSNSADYMTSFNGKIKVYVYDEDGNLIFKDEKYEEIISSPMGFKTEFRTNENYKYIVLSAELYGEENELMDKVFMVYDYSKFKNIPRFLEIKTDKEKYSVDENVEYKIFYKDDENYPLSGKIVVAVHDSEDKILTSFPINVKGEWSNKITFKNPGNYKISALDLEHNLKSEVYINVVEKGIGNASQIILVVGVIIIVIAVVLWIRR